MDKGQTSSNGIFITVAICTRNRANFLRKAVASLLPQLTSDTEVLIIDNASTDNTFEVGQEFARSHERIRIIQEKELGLSAARNAALRASTARFVLFLDDDALAEPSWISSYREFLLHPPASGIVVVGGPVFPDFEVPPPSWLSPKVGLLDYGKPERELAAEAGPWGGNIAYDREAALAAGAFNTALGRKGKSQGAHEEYDLNLRLKERGGRIWWLPNASIKHWMPAQRIRLGMLVRKEMAEGISSAVMRLEEQEKNQRVLYTAGRVLVGPFHCFINLVAALFTTPFNQRKTAARSLMRAARIGGFTWQMCCVLFSGGAWSNKSE